MRWFTAAILALVVTAGFAGCGGSGTPSVGSGFTDYFMVTHDDYGIATPNSLYATNNEAFVSLQANVVTSVSDHNSKCILNIYIPQPVPALAGRTFSIESDNAFYEKFPGEVFVFNTSSSTRKVVDKGVISFDAASDVRTSVAGYFDIVMTDYDSGMVTPPNYAISGMFGFAVNALQMTDPLSPAYPLNGELVYEDRCFACHDAVGFVSPGAASSLSRRGGEMFLYDPLQAGHSDLSNQDISDLKVFLNLH